MKRNAFVVQLCMSPVIKAAGTVAPASLFFERFYMSPVRAQIRCVT
jgi:hypothetical protein